MELFNHNFYCFSINIDEYFIKTAQLCKACSLLISTELALGALPTVGSFIIELPAELSRGSEVKATET